VVGSLGPYRVNAWRPDREAEALALLVRRTAILKRVVVAACVLWWLPVLAAGAAHCAFAHDNDSVFELGATVLVGLVAIGPPGVVLFLACLAAIRPLSWLSVRLALSIWTPIVALEMGVPVTKLRELTVLCA